MFGAQNCSLTIWSGGTKPDTRTLCTLHNNCHAAITSQVAVLTFNITASFRSVSAFVVFFYSAYFRCAQECSLSAQFDCVIHVDRSNALVAYRTPHSSIAAVTALRNALLLSYLLFLCPLSAAVC